MTTDEDQRLLTCEEVASLLAIKTETLAQWRYRRVGPGWVKFGKRYVRYRRSEVERWLGENTQSPSGEMGGGE